MSASKVSLGSGSERAGVMRGGNRLPRDPTIHLEKTLYAVRGEQCAGTLNLVGRSRKVTLSTEARVDGHDQEKVEVADDLLGVRQRSAGVERQSGHHAVLFYRIELALHVDRRLRVKREHRGAGPRERLDVVLRLEDHQVHVEGQGCVRARGADQRPEVAGRPPLVSCSWTAFLRSRYCEQVMKHSESSRARCSLALGRLPSAR